MRFKSDFRNVAACALVLAWLVGCAPAKRDELMKEVLKADPEFAQVLDKYQSLSSRIKTHEQELALARSTIEQKIDRLRKDLASATTSARVKIADVKKKMDPDHLRLEQALAVAGEELRLKRQQRASLGRSIASLRKAERQGGAVWSDRERAQQQAQREETLRDAKRLDSEMQALKEHIRLLKIKLLLIKL